MQSRVSSVVYRRWLILKQSQHAPNAQHQTGFAACANLDCTTSLASQVQRMLTSAVIATRGTTATGIAGSQSAAFERNPPPPCRVVDTPYGSRALASCAVEGRTSPLDLLPLSTSTLSLSLSRSTVRCSHHSAIAIALFRLVPDRSLQNASRNK